MTKPIAPFNNIIVQIDSRYKEEIQLEGGIKLFQDTTYRPEWHVTVTGTVVSLPKNVDGLGWGDRGRLQRQVQVGDEIAFSYLVIFDLKHLDDGDEVFYEEAPINAFLTTYSNRLEQIIVSRYRVEDDSFDVAVLNKEGVVFDMAKRLTPVQRDNFLGKYKFAETNQVSYNNLLELGESDYWMVDYAHVLAIKRGNTLIPASGKAILTPPEMTMHDHEEAGIVLLNPKEHRPQAMSKIIAMGEPLVGDKHPEVEPGDRVLYDGRYAEEYELWGSPVLVLPQKRLLAKV